MKKNLILFISLGIIFINLSAQKPGSGYLKLKYLKEFTFFQGNDTIAPFYMSEKPVTNREYITYLLWLASVYKDYPLNFYYAIPGLKWEALDLNWNDPDEIQLINLVVIKAKTESFVKDYMFNVRYIDYPVVGLTWEQASRFCRWLSDRYNEALLINEKILEFDSYQQRNECFTTEASLADQYIGTVHDVFVDPVTKEERMIQWSDKKLSPSFRLPATCEAAISQKPGGTALVPYRMFSFLDKWHESKSMGDNLFIINKADYDTYDNPLKLASYPDVQIPATSGEWYLDSNLEPPASHIVELFKRLGQKTLDYESMQIEKDSTGHMPYLLIGETPDAKPLIVENYANQNRIGKTTENSGKIFRVAVSAIKMAIIRP
jgi:hypothetical protein